MCVSLSVPPREFELVAMACVPYLSTDQPLHLQTLGSQSFRKLISIDPDTIWLLLSQMAPPTNTTPTHSALKPYVFPTNPDAEKYARNVEPLLLLTFNTF